MDFLLAKTLEKKCYLEKVDYTLETG